MRGANRSKAAFLSAVPALSGPPPGELARRIAERLEGALVEYQHVVDELKQEAARRIEALLWSEAPPGGRR